MSKWEHPSWLCQLQVTSCTPEIGFETFLLPSSFMCVFKEISALSALPSLKTFGTSIQLVVGYTGVMFKMQYLQVSFEAACFSEHFDTSFEKIGSKMMLRRPKNYFEMGAKRGVLRKMVLLKFYLFQRLVRSILYLGT